MKIVMKELIEKYQKEADFVRDTDLAVAQSLEKVIKDLKQLQQKEHESAEAFLKENYPNCDLVAIIYEINDIGGTKAAYFIDLIQLLTDYKSSPSDEEKDKFAIDFANWLETLSPSQKVSVWSKTGELSGLFTMDNEQLLNKFKRAVTHDLKKENKQ